MSANLMDRFKPVLGEHARMAGDRPFYTSCLCGKWRGPASNYQPHLARQLAEVVTTSDEYRQARSAVLYGVTGDAPSNYSGVTKDEALSLAAEFLRWLDGEFEGLEPQVVIMDELAHGEPTFTEEWRTVLVRTNGVEQPGTWGPEQSTRASLAIDLAWFEEQAPEWVTRYKTVRLERRRVYPPEVVE